MRLVIVLSVAAAVTVMAGAILVAVSVVMRMVTKHQPAHMTRLGLDVVAAGIAFGLIVLVVFAIGRIGGAGRSRPSQGRADHRDTAETGSGPAPRGVMLSGPVFRRPEATPGARAERVPDGRPCSSPRTCTHLAASSTCQGTAAEHPVARTSRRSCAPRDPVPPREGRLRGLRPVVEARTGRPPAGPGPSRRGPVTSQE